MPNVIAAYCYYIIMSLLLLLPLAGHNVYTNGEKHARLRSHISTRIAVAVTIIVCLSAINRKKGRKRGKEKKEEEEGRGEISRRKCMPESTSLGRGARPAPTRPAGG